MYLTFAGYFPGSKGRVPAGEAMKYAMTFTLLTSAIMGTQVIKECYTLWR